MIDNKDSENSKRQIDTHYNVFLAYCKENSIIFTPETITKFELNEILGRFYADTRRADGEMYKSSFFTLKFAIHRKMKALRGQDFDTIHNHEFNWANEIFKAQSVLLKKQGVCQVSHSPPPPPPPFSEEDLRTLYKSGTFSSNTQSRYKIKFFLILFFLSERKRTFERVD